MTELGSLILLLPALFENFVPGNNLGVSCRPVRWPEAYRRLKYWREISLPEEADVRLRYNDDTDLVIDAIHDFQRAAFSKERVVISNSAAIDEVFSSRGWFRAPSPGSEPDALVPCGSDRGFRLMGNSTAAVKKRIAEVLVSRQKEARRVLPDTPSEELCRGGREKLAEERDFFDEVLRNSNKMSAAKRVRVSPRQER